jgi:hypothetical protein
VIRSLLRDPAVYADPDTFNPDRFLGPAPEADPESSGNFGYGRRICPGKAMADQSGWLALAMILSCFNIVPVKDSSGTPILDPIESLPGGVSHPRPFSVDFKIRSQKHGELIKELGSEFEWDRGDSAAVRSIMQELDHADPSRFKLFTHD